MWNWAPPFNVKFFFHFRSPPFSTFRGFALHFVPRMHCWRRRASGSFATRRTAAQLRNRERARVGDVPRTSLSLTPLPEDAADRQKGQDAGHRAQGGRGRLRGPTTGHRAASGEPRPRRGRLRRRHHVIDAAVRGRIRYLPSAVLCGFGRLRH